jgi:hypothetical protein
LDGVGFTEKLLNTDLLKKFLTLKLPPFLFYSASVIAYYLGVETYDFKLIGVSYLVKYLSKTEAFDYTSRYLLLIFFWDSIWAKLSIFD